MNVRLSIAFLLLLTAAARGEEKAKIEIYPLDRATILAGQKFDLKFEFPAQLVESDAQVTINGKSIADVFGKAATFIPKEDGLGKLIDRDSDNAAEDLAGDEQPLYSALLVRDCVLKSPGTYTVVAKTPTHTATVAWEVYATPEKRVAKNVILMVGDGMSLAHRKAARVMSKGIKEGKHLGKLAMDDMPHMALLNTSGVDNVVTDSANSAVAYTTGHKTSNAALGVYADRTKNTFDDPKFETLAYLARRYHNMSVGIVTTSEIQDATPASLVAHTRSRGERSAITEMLLQAQPEVLLGGGASAFTAKVGIDKEKRDSDYYTRFAEAGYALAKNRTELAGARKNAPAKLLGLFTAGNMDGVLDREFLKKGANVERYPDQPGLEEMTQTALDLLARNENGFVLLVESALIDKYSHRMDWERAVFDTIMFDKTVALVKDWAAARGDTLILVTADHGHCINTAGVVDDNKRGPAMRDKLTGGYPNYVDANGDGYPDDLNVSRRLQLFFSAHPDYYETFRPKLDGPFTPSALRRSLPPSMTANDKYKDLPGAQLREGNLPRLSSATSHSGDDVILTGTGPGSEQIRGSMDNTEVFRVIANALALGDKEKK